MESIYKLDGIMSITEGNLISREIEQGEDKDGRWGYTKPMGIDKQIITVLTIYQTCKSNKKWEQPPIINK
eukprot:15366826-Ditylum_brightwellii.AAC.1